MKYQQPTFTLPTTNRKMTQTEYEIAVGLRNADGSLVQPKKARCPECRQVGFHKMSCDSR